MGRLAGGLHRATAGSVVAVLLGFQVAIGAAAPLPDALSRLLLTGLMAVLILPMAGRKDWRFVVPAAAVALLPLAGSLFDQVGDRAWSLLALLVAVLSVALGARDAGQVALYRLLAAALALASAGWLSSLHAAGAWQAGELYAAAVSGLTSALAGYGLVFGPTFAGFWPFTVFGILLCLAAAEARTRPRALARLGAALLLGAVAVLMTTFFTAQIERGFHGLVQAAMTVPEPHQDDADLPLLRVPSYGAHVSLWVLSAVLALIAGALVRPAARSAEARGGPAARRRRMPLGLAGAGLAVAGAFFLLRTPAPQVPETSRVVFADLGGAHFTVAEKGRYGLINAGMFGAFRQLLEARGAEVTVVAPASLAASLAGAEALVVINPQQGLDAAASEAVWRFVAGGGRLLAMGDHTDLFGLMGHFNDLLAPVGVRFNFDSAFPLRRHWQYVQSFHGHPTTAGLRGQRDIHTGTGASLTLSGLRVRPLVVGRYAFADLGNRLNDGAGAFLGDYRHQAGERLGDTAVVALASYGRGSVLVFGDTTQFQVLSMPQSFDFILAVIDHLLGSRPPHPAARLGGALALLAGIASLLFVFGGWMGSGAAAAALLLGQVAVQATAPAPGFPPALAQRTAIVDSSLLPGVPWVLFGEGAVGGLYTALHRSGHYPVVSSHLVADPGVQAKMYVFVAPSRLPGRATVERLGKALAAGSTLFVAAAPPHLEPANRLLELCGLSLRPQPLGPAAVATPAGMLEFTDAWRVETSQRPDAVVHAAWQGNPMVVEVPVGRGRCVAFGDVRFLEDENLEGEYDFHPVNVPFFDAVLAGGAVPEANAKP